MHINEIIKKRRATPPKFMLNEKVDKELIEQMLENANWAPNHKKTEPWRFQVYTGDAKEKLADDVYRVLDEKIKKGTDIHPQKAADLRENIKRVPVVLVISMERDGAKRLPEWEEIAAVSMAVQNMWLTATEMRLGAFWASPQFLPLLNEVLNIHQGQMAMGFFYVGKTAMDYPSPGRGPVDTKVEWK